MNMIVNAAPERIGPQEYRGLSTDTKPTDAPNQSVFLETDTSKIYFYDKDSTTWNEWVPA